MFEPKPLTTRLDPLLHAREPVATDRPWTILSRGAPGLSLRLPIYSRILHDAKLSEGMADVLAKACGEKGIPWLDNRTLCNSQYPFRIASLDVDASVDASSFASACAVQIQLYGTANEPANPRFYAHWTPSLPPELFSIEQLAHKVDALRSCVRGGIPIGAAVVCSELTVYEDIRYLIDSGFDWIEVLQSPAYDLTPNSFVELGDFDSLLGKALKARADSKKRCGLWFASSHSDPKVWIQWMARGVQGVCVDGYLASRRPVSSAPRDTLAGIRVQSSHTQESHHWLLDATQELASFLTDAIHFRLA